MIKIIHVSDTHIASWPELVVGHDPRARFRRVVEAINQLHGDAALCVITGDLTDRGDEAAYRAFAEIAADLKMPYRLLLGNHDNRTNFLQVFPDAPTDSAGFVQSVADLPDTRLIFLDTLDEAHPGKGKLCYGRLLWLEAALDDAERVEKTAVIFMHHPPFSVGVPVFDDMLLGNPEPFLTLLGSRASVRHLVFGHLHLTTSGSWRGVPFSCNRGVGHRIVLDLHADFTTYVDSEPTFDVLLIGRDQVLVHHTAPIEEADVIAREYPTPDGHGRIELYPL